MARIRSVHPAICDDRELAGISATAERTFVRLWTQLDDEGRHEDRPRLLAARLYPEHDDVGAEEVDRDLDELARHGLILRYEVAGVRYLSAKPDQWKRYQKPKHPRPSELPPPPETGSTPEPPAEGSPPVPPARPTHVPRTGKRVPEPGTAVPQSLHGVGEGVGGGVGGGEPLAPAPPPRGLATRRVDPLWDALVAELGFTPSTKSARGAWNGAVGALRAVGATADEIHARCGEYRRRWPEASLSPPALAKHWDALGVPAPRPRPRGMDAISRLASGELDGAIAAIGGGT